ncbi:MAG: histidine phosphatase family protein [Bdellovibrio sp.]|nr:histidine phosphatase family protein [Bdellovibrio sp.]
MIRRMQGHTDIPLNPEGQAQARQLQDYFKQNPVEFFVTSDLSRAHETAQIANEQLRRPLVINSALREVSLGVLEGMTLQEAHDQFGVSAWEQWTSIDPQHLDFRFPQAESPREAITRFSDALRALCHQENFAHAAVSTHGFVLRRFLHSLRPDLTEVLPTPNCVVYSVTWDAQKKEFSFLF